MNDSFNNILNNIRNGNLNHQVIKIYKIIVEN